MIHWFRPKPKPAPTRWALEADLERRLAVRRNRRLELSQIAHEREVEKDRQRIRQALSNFGKVI